MPCFSVSLLPPLVKSQAHKSLSAPETLLANQQSGEFNTQEKQPGKMKTQTNTAHKLKTVFSGGWGREEEEAVV